MKRVLLFVFAFSLTIGSLANGQSGLSIQVQTLANQAILGERLICTMTWENQGKSPIILAYELTFINPLIQVRLRGPVSKECIAEGFKAEWGVGPRVVIGAGEKQTYSFSPTNFGAVNVGDYEMWIEYDATALEPFWDSYGVNRIRAESNHVHFNIVSPQPNDTRVFSRHANRCNQITLSPQDLLRRYPASTYAAYALAQTYGLKGYTPPLDVERERAYLVKLQKTGRDTLMDRTRHFATGPDGKEIKSAEGKPVPVTTEEWLRKSVEQAEQMCTTHPELSITEQLRYNVVGFYYTELLQFQNAAKVFEKLHESAADPQVRENSRKMLQLLKEAGLVAN